MSQPRPTLRSLPKRERWRLLRGRLTLVGVVCISIYILNLWIIHLMQVHLKLKPSYQLPGQGLPQAEFSTASAAAARRPPLNEIVQGWNVTGDPSWLLNLAIIGFPKTGTSTLMHYLHKSSTVHVFDEERCEMGYNQHVKLIESLYQDIPPADHLIRGIKCPRDLESNLALSNYQQFFPQTDFMIGLRHPVLWFESLYNFRVQNLFDMPPAETLIGRCKRQNIGVCTFRGNFHLFLANLGKTNISTNPLEYQWVAPEYQRLLLKRQQQQRRRIFLWDISQLHADNHQFRQDLQDFLHLPEELPPMIWVKPGFHHKQNQTVIQDINRRKINICHDKYQPLRQVLLAQATNASRWIQTYFLNAEGVYVSNKDHFVNTILNSWEQDPCP